MDLLRQFWQNPVTRRLRKDLTELLSGALAVVMVALLVVKFGDWLIGNHKPEPTLESRISELSTLLINSAQRIGEIESEVRRRQELVEKLQTDAETAKRLSAVNKEQAEAIAQTLRGELKRQSEHHWWSENWLHFTYMIMGFLLAELYHYFFKHRFDRWRAR